MRLVYPKYDFTAEFEENREMILYLEKPEIFSEVVRDLWNQTNGNGAEFILTNNEKEINFGKEVILIFNPFAVSCNEKKIITKLYQEIEEMASEKYFLELAEVNSALLLLLENLSQDIHYPIGYKDEFIFSNFLKSYLVEFDVEAESILENLINYIKIVHKILKQHIFIFLNLKSYLNEQQMEMFYEACNYEKVFLLLIEGKFQDKILKGEKVWIFDNDYCIIKLSE